jgi:hypothetical protein
MKRIVVPATFLLAAVLLAAPQRLRAQASDLPSAAPASATSGQSDTERGRQLIDEMITALGGPLWLNRATIQIDARTSSFFHGQPNPYITEYHEQRRLAVNGQPEADRVGFLTERGMIEPGKKIDVVQIWTKGHGYEVTYKGQAELPKDQVEDYYRRQVHSIENVVHDWLNAPGVMIVAEGTLMVERRLADRVSVLTANNDAVTIDLDAATHLPIRRTFRSRNAQFNDYDEDAESYDDYHTIQGLPTPMTITRYHNGDMAGQRYYTKVVYNLPMDPSLFDPSVALKKK